MKRDNRKIATKLAWLRRDTPKAAAELDAFMKQIYAESNFVLKIYENSAGRVMLNVIDPREGDPNRIKPFTISTVADWEEFRSVGNTEADNHA